MLKLRAENLVKIYKGRSVVNDVSVEVNQGEIVGLLGPNGAGKTTSFYMIVGLIPPDKGKIYLSDKELTGLAMYKRSQMGVGYLPQEASVFRNLSVEDNVAAVLEMTKLTKAEQKDRLETLLAEFGINRVRKSPGNVLSGGERRRTEIARALATDPKFILLDEPFAGIDPIAVEDIQRIVEKLKQRNIGVLITDHNVQETLSITDRAYLLFEGKILKAGTAQELADDPVVRRVYLGQNFELRKKNISGSHDVDKAGNAINYTSLLSYTERISNENRRMQEAMKNAGPRNLLVTLMGAGFEDYLRSIAEYKTMVTDFAFSHHHENLKVLADSIKLEIAPGKLSLYLEFLPIISGLFRAGAAISANEKYTSYFNDMQSVLNRISAALQLAAGEKEWALQN
jgi:lipopolysaccharide export system ATP-binding protein